MSAPALAYLFGAWKGRNMADRGGTGRKGWSRDEQTFPGSRPNHATCKPRLGVAVEIRRGETVGQGLQECDDLILLSICQAQVAAGHIDIVRYLWHWRAVTLRSFPPGNVGGQVIGYLSRVFRNHDLLQTLQVAVVEKFLLEVGTGSFGDRTLLRC